MVSQIILLTNWGEPDPLIDFSVEEILDMPTVSEVQSDQPQKVSVTDSDLQIKSDYPAMDSEKPSQKSSKASNSVRSR